MSAFGGLILTNKGRALQAKAQTGTQLNFTRMAAGDGELGGTSIQDLNALIHEVKSLVLTKLQTLSNGKALVRTFFSNQDVVTGFYFREIGVFAQDPDEGEILYCYGNAGANAEYIPAAGGADIIEKNIDVITIVGNASNVTATIDESLIFASAAELIAVQNEVEAIENGDRTLDQTQAPAGNVGPLQTILDWFANRIKAITGKTYWYEAPDTSLAATKGHMDAAAPHSGHETPAGAQAKADAAAATGVAAAGTVQQNLESHINEIATSGANKILRLLPSGEGNISITGNAATATNADTLDGKHANELGLNINSGSFVESTSLVANGTYTKSIPLGANDYKKAKLMLKMGNISYYAGAIVNAKTTISSGHSLVSYTNGAGSVAAGGFSRAVDSYLSLNFGNALNKGVSGNDNIALEHCYINGSNLEIKWKNFYSSATGLSISCQWEVLK